MTVRNLAGERLVRAMVAANTAIVTDNPQQRAEKEEELRRAYEAADEQTRQDVLGPKEVTLREALDGVVSFAKSLQVLADIINRWRR